MTRPETMSAEEYQQRRETVVAWMKEAGLTDYMDVTIVDPSNPTNRRGGAASMIAACPPLEAYLKEMLDDPDGLTDVQDQFAMWEAASATES